MRHIRRVYEAFKNMPHVVLYTAMPDTMYFVPVLGFNVRGMQSEEVGEVLAKRNIAVRCGFHCAPLVHRKMGTDGAKRPAARCAFRRVRSRPTGTLRS